jgi:uncharacterized membrane protein
MKKEAKNVSYVLGGLLLISLVLSIWLGINSFRIVFGSFIVLFLPGFSIVYNFFKELDLLETIALSFALSIAIVPLVVFYLSLVSMPITWWSTLLVIVFIVGVSFGIKMYKKT